MNRMLAPLFDPDPPIIKGAALIGKALDPLNNIGAADALASAAALSAAGYARIGAGEHGHALSHRCLELAQNARQSHNLTAIAAPELRRLRDLTGEIGCLAPHDDGASVSSGRVESRHTHRSLGSTIGGRRPLHCSAHGKAIPARMPAPDIELFSEAPQTCPRHGRHDHRSR